MEKKLKLATRLIYGSGDFYGGASATIISMLFLFFLTDVVGLRPFFAGIIIFIGRFVDAITDPMMGNISDRTKSRWGRRNPYFLFFAIPVGISFSLLWMKVDLGSQFFTTMYYAIAYSLFSIVFTAVMVPYSALAPELTTDYNERTTLISTRMAFSILGALSAAVIPKTIIESMGSQASGFIFMAIAFSILFVIIWLLMFYHMRDKEVYANEFHNTSFVKALISCFKNKSFVSLIGIYLFSFIPNDIMSANFIFYLTHYLQKPGLYTVIMGGLLVSAVISLFVYTKLVKSLGKRNTYLIGASYWILMLSFLVFFNENVSSNLLIIYAVFLGFGVGVSYAIPWAMLPEVIDVDEVITFQRREGLYSGVMTFLRKLSSSITIFGMAYILELSGYQPTINEEIIQQSESAILAIKYSTALGPILFLGFALFSAAKFPISSENYKHVRKYLDWRNQKSAKSLGSLIEEPQGEILKDDEIDIITVSLEKVAGKITGKISL